MCLGKWLSLSKVLDRRRSLGRRARGARPHIDTLESRDLLSFTPATPFPAGDSPFAVAVADINGDGNQDLAAGNFGTPGVAGGSVSVRLGDGRGGFGAITPFVVGGGVRHVAVGDFNEDGRPDLATANFDDDSISVLINMTSRGASTPSFAPAVRLLLAARADPFVVAVSDLDRDGNLDLASADQGLATVTIFQGDGAGGFVPAGRVMVGPSPRSIVVGDFDGDSKPDLVTTSFTGRSVSVLHNESAGPGDFTFTATSYPPLPTAFPAGSRPFSVAVGDWNGDRSPDLAVVSFLNPGSLFVLLNDSTGAFPTFTTHAIASQSINVITHDFNSDGRADLAVSGFSSNPSILNGDVTVLLGDGSGGFAAREVYAVGIQPRWVAAGDFNNDGAPDLVTADDSSGTVSVLLNRTVVPAAVVETAVINDGAVQRSTVTSITVTFSSRVNVLPGAFEVRRENGDLIELETSTSEVNGRTVAVLTFTGADIVGGSLADGRYTLTIRGDLVRDNTGTALDGDGDGAAGGNRLDRFFRLYGDTDGDADVDLTDLLDLVEVLNGGPRTPLLQAAFDFDGDGTIGYIDINAFIQRFGRPMIG